MKDPVLAAKSYRPAHARVTMTLRAMGGLHYIKGNHAPYFALTKEEHRKGLPNQCWSGGCDHETLLKHWPRFSDLAALHLSDIEGVPMGAEANGWYDLAGALPDHAAERFHRGNSEMHFPKPAGAPRRGEWDNTDYRKPYACECVQIFADHVRVSVETACELRDKVVSVYTETGDWKAARQYFSQWIEEQKPRWKAEAEACIKKHNLRLFGDKWPEAEDVTPQAVASGENPGL